MQFRRLYLPLTEASKKIIIQHCIMKRFKENTEKNLKEISTD